MVNYLELKERYLNSVSHKKKTQEREYFRTRNGLNEAVVEAIGKGYPHQNRVRKDAITEINKNIGAIEAKCKTANTFKDFQDSIETSKVKWYGRLARVDFTFRMASYTGIMPRDVPIQSGSYEGAKSLCLNINKDSYGGHYIKITDIPEELRDLDAITLENFLCWYAHYKKKNKLNN